MNIAIVRGPLLNEFEMQCYVPARAKIKDLILDEEGRSKLGELGRKKVSEKFNAEKIASRLENLYRSLY